MGKPLSNFMNDSISPHDLDGHLWIEMLIYHLLACNTKKLINFCCFNWSGVKGQFLLFWLIWYRKRSIFALTDLGWKVSSCCFGWSGTKGKGQFLFWLNWCERKKLILAALTALVQKLMSVPAVLKLADLVQRRRTSSCFWLTWWSR